MLLPANLDGCSALPELAVIPCCLCKRAPIHPDHRENQGQGMGKEEGEAAVLSLEKMLKHPERGGGGVAGRGKCLGALETTNLQVFFRGRGIGLGDC